MNDTHAICTCIAMCVASICTTVGYWLKKRKQVSVTKIIKINVLSDEANDEPPR